MVVGFTDRQPLQRRLQDKIKQNFFAVSRSSWHLQNCDRQRLLRSSETFSVCAKVFTDGFHPDDRGSPFSPWFAREDGERDGLSPDMRFSEEELRAWFDRMDRKHRGMLDRPDLEQALSDMRVPCSQADLDEIFAKADRNRDGFIGFQEFARFIRRREILLMRVFNELDANKDHVVGPADLQRALDRLGIPVEPEEIRSLIAHLDREQTGSLNYNSFRSFCIMLPRVSPRAIFRRWSDAAGSMVDFSPDMSTIPSEVKKVSGGAGAFSTLLAGAIAGAVSRTVTAPLDRLKVLLQANATSREHGIVQSLFEIRKEGGWTAYFRGNGTNVVKIAPETAIKFWAYELLKRYFCENPVSLTLFERFWTGASAGLVSQVAIYPLEIIKTRLAVSRVSKTIWECSKIILREGGVRSFYRGLGASCVGVVPYCGIDLGIYSLLKDSYAARFGQKEPGVLTLLGCGVISSGLAQAVSYPLAVMKTRMQVFSENQHLSFRQCAVSIWKTDGWRGFYRGLLVNYMKVLPAVGISYSVYESVKLRLVQP